VYLKKNAACFLNKSGALLFIKIEEELQPNITRTNLTRKLDPSYGTSPSPKKRNKENEDKQQNTDHNMTD
jgi:hypothetical protein